MKTFKEYLMEKWNVDQGIYRHRGKRTFVYNIKNIDGHDVRLDLNGSGPDANEYNVEYTVDNDFYKRKKMDPETGSKIVKHVNRSLNTFIRHMKPKSMYFQSNLDRNIALHDSLAKRLTKRHGGTIEVGQTPMGSTYHKVIFK